MYFLLFSEMFSLEFINIHTPFMQLFYFYFKKRWKNKGTLKTQKTYTSMVLVSLN